MMRKSGKGGGNGPCYQMYADRANGSGALGRLTWAQRGMFYWVLNRAWLDGGVPRDPKALSAMMPGGPKVTELAPVLALFTADGEREGEVTHVMHVEQRARHAELSRVRTAAIRKRWGAETSDDTKGDTNVSPSVSGNAGKTDTKGIPSQPPNLPVGSMMSPDISTSPPKGGDAGGEARRWPAGFPRSAKEAADAAFATGVPADYAETVWHEVVGANFQGRDGKPVANWSHFVTGAFRRRESWRRENPNGAKKTEGVYPKKLTTDESHEKSWR